MNNKNIIQKAFNDVIFVERIHQVAYQKCVKCSDYGLVRKEIEKLQSQLESTFSTNEQKELLSQLESNWDFMYSYFLKFSYCQGIEDSKMIHQELHKFGISVSEENTLTYGEFFLTPSAESLNVIH